MTNQPLTDNLLEKGRPNAQERNTHQSAHYQRRDRTKRLGPKEILRNLETILEMIKSTLASGEDVLISEFGKFCVKEKRKRRGGNPATGENMILVPRRVVTFK